MSAATFVVCLVVALWNTLRWGKEAETFEAEIKEEDEIEKERRRRSELDRTLKQDGNSQRMQIRHQLLHLLLIKLISERRHHAPAAGECFA